MVMTGKMLHKNNKGSALIVVIVCMLFIGIISAIVLTVVRSNLKNAGLHAQSSDNFYEGEEALDELKTSLKDYADDALRKAYEDWLKKYSSFDPSKQSTEFSKLFAEEFQTLIQNYFKLGDGDTGTKTPLDGLLYNADVTFGDTPVLITTTDSNGNTIILIKDISITQTDVNGNVTKINTDLQLKVATPTMQIGSNTGINSNIADYALVADTTIDFSSSGGTKVVGSIYGGGKGQVLNNEGNVISEYGGNPGIKFNDTSGLAVELYSDYIISRSGIESDQGNLKTFGTKQYPYSATKYYSQIWVTNILLNRTGRSSFDIQGNCSVADDLTIDSDHSSFKLTGDKSTYYGYNTSSESKKADTSSSIVVNGKNVTINLKEASMLWLAGKSYVAVPSQWGNPNTKNDTFMQGESISYRSLQPAYLLPGECIVGINHNPMLWTEYTELAQEISNGTRDNYYIDLSRGSAGNGMNLELYLDTTDQTLFTSAFHVSVVRYGTDVEGENEADKQRRQLVYLYMNFSNPNRAAAYFRDYTKAFNELVKGRAEMAEAGTSLTVNRSGAYKDPSTGALVLDPNKVVNTGNILWYAPVVGRPTEMEFQMYGANTDYTDAKITSMKYSKDMEYRKLCTSLSDTSLGSLNKDITDLLVNYGYAVSDEKADKVVRITGDNGLFEVAGTTETRRAYVVSAKDDVWITGEGIKFGVDGAAGSIVTKDINNEDIINKDGNKTNLIKAGIIIAGGDVYIEGGLDFWGTVIAKGNIVFQGKNCKVLAAASNVRKLIETSDIVAPYFSEGSLDSSASGVSSSYIDIEFVNWTKE